MFPFCYDMFPRTGTKSDINQEVSCHVEIYRLREMKQNAMADSAEREGLKLRIDKMRQFLDEQTESITEYDEKLTRRLIEKKPSTKTISRWNSNPAQAWMSTDK